MYTTHCNIMVMVVVRGNRYDFKLRLVKFCNGTGIDETTFCSCSFLIICLSSYNNLFIFHYLLNGTCARPEKNGILLASYGKISEGSPSVWKAVSTIFQG